MIGSLFGPSLGLPAAQTEKPSQKEEPKDK